MDNTTEMNNSEYQIDIVYNETHKQLEMKKHFHNSHQIIYILEGNVEFKINERKYHVAQNSIVFINNFESHELKVKGSTYKRYFILIKPDYLQHIVNEPLLLSIFKHRPPSFNHVIRLDDTQKNEVSGLFLKIFDEYKKSSLFFKTVIELHIKFLLVFLYRNYKKNFPAIAQNSSTNIILNIQKYIEEHYNEDITLKKLSKLFYTDMYYLSHLFKKLTGFTFKEYLILQRLSKSRDLLLYTSQSITLVGLNSGFNCVNHFIRTFKKFQGLTPLQYRKKHQLTRGRGC